MSEPTVISSQTCSQGACRSEPACDVDKRHAPSALNIALSWHLESAAWCSIHTKMTSPIEAPNTWARRSPSSRRLVGRLRCGALGDDHSSRTLWRGDGRVRKSDLPLPTAMVRITHVASRVILTAREFKTTRKSVISAPAWLPTPRPAVPMALGADHAAASGERVSCGDA